MVGSREFPFFLLDCQQVTEVHLKVVRSKPPGSRRFQPAFCGNLISVCPNLSFPHTVSGNSLLISSRFRLKDCRNDKNRGISGQTLLS